MSPVVPPRPPAIMDWETGVDQHFSRRRDLCRELSRRKHWRVLRCIHVGRVGDPHDRRRRLMSYQKRHVISSSGQISEGRCVWAIVASRTNPSSGRAVRRGCLWSRKDSSGAIGELQTGEKERVAAARARSSQSLQRAQGRAKLWDVSAAGGNQVLKFRMIEAKPKIASRPEAFDRLARAAKPLLQ